MGNPTLGKEPGDGGSDSCTRQMIKNLVLTLHAGDSSGPDPCRPPPPFSVLLCIRVADSTNETHHFLLCWLVPGVFVKRLVKKVALYSCFFCASGWVLTVAKPFEVRILKGRASSSAPLSLVYDYTILFLFPPGLEVRTASLDGESLGASTFLLDFRYPAYKCAHLLFLTLSSLFFKKLIFIGA